MRRQETKQYSKAIEYLLENAKNNPKKKGEKIESPNQLKYKNIREIAIASLEDGFRVRVGFYENFNKYFTVKIQDEDVVSWQKFQLEYIIKAKEIQSTSNLFNADDSEDEIADNTTDDIQVGLQVIDGVLYDNGRKQF